MFFYLFRQTCEPQVKLWVQPVQRPTVCTLWFGELNVLYSGCRKSLKVKGVHIKVMSLLCGQWGATECFKEGSDMT